MAAEAESIGRPLKDGHDAIKNDYRLKDDENLKQTQEKLREQLEQEEKVSIGRHAPEFTSLGYNVYFVINFAVLWIPMAVVIFLMSSIGAGLDFTEWLDDKGNVSLAFGGLLIVLFCVLYCMDFFWPPHLPGFYCTFSHHDRTLGNVMVAICAFLLFCAGLFSAKTNPQMPVLVTTVSAPVFVVAVRMVHNPGSPPRPTGAAHRRQSVRTRFMESFQYHHDDWRMFYAGAMCAFFLVGGMAIFAWLCWMLGNERDPQHLYDGIDAGSEERGRVFLVEVAPFCAGLGYILFGLIVTLRFRFEDVITSPHHELKLHKQDKQARGSVLSLGSHDGEAELKEVLIERHLETEQEKEEFQKLSPEQKEKFTRCHLEQLKQVSSIIKYIGSGFVAFMGVLYVSFELVAADSPAAQLFLGVWGAFGFFSVVFLAVSFSRFMAIMKGWCQELPLFRMAKTVACNDWARAALLICTACMVPFILLLSMVNQCCRRYRNLYERVGIGKSVMSKADIDRIKSRPQASKWDDLTRNSTVKDAEQPVMVADEDDPKDSRLTQRVVQGLHAMEQWNWIAIVMRMYILSVLFVGYTLTPRVLNIFLSWLSSLLSGLDYATLVVMTLISGITCFLLPPVPGLPVYIFSGVLLVGQADFDFWAACGVATTVGFLLKLMACAMQQKLIGELLGNSLWVRSQCGVNKPLIRAIELVLRDPGTWTVGKVAILCGGPDWPTSVLAGILKLNIFKMELGTLPIILFITPCTLSGAFYLRKEESEFWSRAASLMVSSTALMGLFMWMMAAWKIQEKLDEDDWEVTRPLVKNVDLDWLDFRSQEIAKVCTATWSTLPCHIKCISHTGLFMILCVCYLFFWRASLCFGDFAVTADINTLVLWKGDDGIIKPAGMAGLAISGVAMLGFLVLHIHITMSQKEAVNKKAAELDANEKDWKEKFVQKAAEVEKAGPPKLKGFHVDDEIGAEVTRRATMVDIVGDIALASVGVHHSQDKE
jgi:hypothetical protein